MDFEVVRGLFQILNLLFDLIPPFTTVLTRLRGLADIQIVSSSIFISICLRFLSWINFLGSGNWFGPSVYLWSIKLSLLLQITYIVPISLIFPFITIRGYIWGDTLIPQIFLKRKYPRVIKPTTLPLLHSLCYIFMLLLNNLFPQNTFIGSSLVFWSCFTTVI